MAQKLFGAGVNPRGVEPEPIRPTPTPGSTYVKPQQIEVGDNAARLAASLKHLSGDLSKYGARQERDNKDPNSEANKAVTDRMATMSTAELNAMKITPEMTRIQRDALNVLQGSRAVDSFEEEWINYYNGIGEGEGFDQANGNARAELDARRQAHMNALPTDAAKAAFMKSSQGFYDRAMAGDMKRRGGVALVARDTAILSNYKRMVTEGLNNGTDPLLIADELFKSAGINKRLLELDGPSQNAVIYKLAQQMAADNRPQMAEAILNHDRGGVGSVMSSSEYSVKGIELIEAAQTRKDKADREDQVAVGYTIDSDVREGKYNAGMADKYRKKYPWITARESQSWVDQSTKNRERKQAAFHKAETTRINLNMFNSAVDNNLRGNVSRTFGQRGSEDISDVTVMGKDGVTPFHISRETQIKETIPVVMKMFEDKVADSDIPDDQKPGAVLNLKLEWAAANDVILDEHINTFSGMDVSASAVMNYSEKGVPKEYIEAAELYRTLHAKNSSYVKNAIKDEDTRAFFETYRIAKGAGKTDEQSMSRAIKVAGYTDAERSAAKANRKDVVEGFNDIDWPATVNDNLIDLGHMEQQVQTLVLNGIGPDKAIEIAQKNMLEQSVVVNGNLINSQDRKFPRKTFVSSVTGILKEYAEKNSNKWGLGATTKPNDISPEGDPIPVDNSDQLSVRAIGNGKFEIINVNTGEGVLGSPLISYEDIARYEQREGEKALVSEQSWKEEVKNLGAFGAYWEKLKNRMNGTVMPELSLKDAKALAKDDIKRAELSSFVNMAADAEGYRLTKGPNGEEAWIDTKTGIHYKAEVRVQGHGGQSITWVKTGRKAETRSDYFKNLKSSVPNKFGFDAEDDLTTKNTINK